MVMDRTGKKSARDAVPDDRSGRSVDDAVLLETPSGRSADSGAHPGTRLDDELSDQNASASGLNDLADEEESDAGETRDGLDEIEEEVRHAAEDVPSGDGTEGRGEDLPVFETGLTGPRI
jgi:hypothetical protein